MPMSRKDELELDYLRAQRKWMKEHHTTEMMLTAQNASGFEQQLAKEEAALKEYRSAQRAFINALRE